jgi:SAM-dependent methyltransferase
LPNWPASDRQTRGDEVRRFFERRAVRYDEIAHRPYWRFCGELLERLLERTLFRRFRQSAPLRVLDAGGGTGQYALRILTSFPNASVVLVDFSDAMLEKARSKARRAGVASRLSIHRADLQDPIGNELGLFDLVICFYNVASLVADPAALIRNLRSKVKPGGALALVVPNRYSAAWACARDGRLSELKRIRESSVVRYRPGFPDVLLFSPEVVRRTLAAARCEQIAVYGFPVLLPGVRSDARLPRHLMPPRVRSRLLAADLQLCLEEESAARGQELLAIAWVPKPRT